VGSALDESSDVNDQRWWRRAVLYQVYPRSFTDTAGDGVGDLRGIISRLDHLQWLGIDALWLSPIYPSPMADFGYDVADHTDVDPLFGTLADVDDLLAQAHARGIKVVLDYVPAHTSDLHPWFEASRRSRDDPRRDWYVWRDPLPDGRPPNNWTSQFGGGPAWTFDARTGQCYLHTFLPEQPDLNWRNPAVREAMREVLRFWMRRGVDGFRVDVAHRILKEPGLRDNPPDPAFRSGMPAQRRVVERYSRNWHEVHEVHRMLRATVEEFDEPPRLLAGEVNLDPADLVAYYGADDELHLPLNFHTIVDMPWTPRALAALVADLEGALPDHAWPSWVLSNHDKSRFPTRVGPHLARQGMVFLLTARGTPVLYYGDEIALGDTAVPPDRVRDPWGRHVPGLGRDPQRCPMPWNGSANAGFCAPEVEPWLPLSADAGTRNVAAQRADPQSVLTLVRALIALRAARPSLRDGAYAEVAVTDDVFAYARTTADERTLIILAFDAPATLPLPGPHRLLCSTGMDRDGVVDGEVTLERGEALVLDPLSGDPCRRPAGAGSACPRSAAPERP
jgi:alpha-glucosidase